LRERGTTLQTLPVRVPFHSPLVEPVRGEWLRHFGNDLPEPGTIPVIGQCDEARHPSYAHALWEVIREPFDFQAALAGLDSARALHFVDVGPSGTLANWVNYSSANRPRWRATGLLSPWGGDYRRLCELSAAAGIDAVPA
jgi:acyl transferase domain-containing protein